MVGRAATAIDTSASTLASRWCPHDTLHYNSTLSITIPPGNYSANALGKKIVALFNGAGVTMTSTYDRVTQKYTFTSSNSLKFDFEKVKENSIKNELGFSGFEGNAVIQPVSGNSNVSTSAADLNGSVVAIL